MRLDAHQHFWDYRPSEYPWIQPEWPIRKSFMPEDLAPLLRQHHFQGSIAVQARQSLEETRWLLELSDRHSLIKGVVGWVDLRSRKAETQLAGFAGHPRFVGVRHVLQDEDPSFIMAREFVDGVRLLRQFDLTYDLLVFPRHLAATIELVRQLPEQPFVLDHIAKPSVKTGALSPWRERIRELAECRNVCCKVSGLITEANWQSWRREEFDPCFDVILAAFGPERLMFGSDWPVALLAGSYDKVCSLATHFASRLQPIERDWFFGVNAANFYGLSGTGA